MYVFVCRQVDAALDDVVKMDTGGGGGGGGGGRGRGRGGPMRGRGGPMRGRGGFRGGMMGMRAVPYGGRGGQVCDNCFQPGISSLHFCSYGFCAHGGFGFVLLISMDHTMFTHILKLWDNLLMTLAFCVQVTNTDDTRTPRRAIPNFSRFQSHRLGMDKKAASRKTTTKPTSATDRTIGSTRQTALPTAV